MSEWQPIETAPKDGSLILLCDARVRDWQLTAFYDVDLEMSEDYVWQTQDGLTYSDKMFTHWMPLPNPPIDNSLR